MKRVLLASLIAGLIIVSGCKQEKVELKTEEDKTFYTIGHMFGARLQNLDLSDNEISAINAGIRDAAKGEKSKVNVKEYQVKVQQIFRDRMEKKAKTTKKDGMAYLDKFVAEGATKTASGLAYKIIKEGTGKKPGATDTVKVHYHGTLIDGTVFDSSVERGQPVSFPLNRVIKGWTEGLQYLQEGGKIKLVIPSDLAYGDAGAPPKIPGGATLVFEVELFEVKATQAPAAPKKKSKKK